VKNTGLFRKQEANCESGPRTLNYTPPIPLGPVGRRLSRALLSYIMSAGRINRPLPYTCLLSTRGIISINRNTSAQARVLSRSRTARGRCALGSYGRDENGKMARNGRPKTFARALAAHPRDWFRLEGPFNVSLAAGLALCVLDISCDNWMRDAQSPELARRERV